MTGFYQPCLVFLLRIEIKKVKTEKKLVIIIIIIIIIMIIIIIIIVIIIIIIIYSLNIAPFTIKMIKSALHEFN